MQTEI